jgi:hypothetical protein
MPTPEIQDEWARRVVAEYRSAAHTSELATWLIEVAAAPELVRDALRIVSDELTHAELSAGVLDAAGGSVSGVVARESLRLPRTEPVEWAIVRAGVEIFCLGETVAVPLFRRMLAGATVPVARGALRRIVADEARHRRFGWDLLDWARASPARPVVEHVLENELPAMIARVRSAYGEGRREDIPDTWRAWGLIAPAEYALDLKKTEQGWWRRRLGPYALGG